MRRIRRILAASVAILLCALVDGPGRAWSEPDSAGRQSQPALHHSPASKRLPIYAAAKALVRDLRVSQDQSGFRLVLDLTKKVRIVQGRDKHTGRLLLDLRHTSLSKAAADKFVASTVLPQSVHVTLSQLQDSLRISLNKSAVGQFHYFQLERPHRFVLDFTVATPEAGRQAGSTAPSASLPASNQTPASPAAAAAEPSGPTTAPRRSGADIRTIVLDPGHGGKDAGTISRRGLQEKQVTLKVALRLRDLIQSRLGKRVLMTRERDEFIELGDRAKFANANNADLFLSIHVNSHPQSSVKGIEIYHFGEAKDQRALAVAARENGTPINNNGVGWEYLVADLLTTKRIEDSMEFAWQTKQAMLHQLTGRYPTDDHGVKTAPFYVLRYTAMPSILAEIAFMSNPSEEQLMRQPSFINEVAEALFSGLKNYLDPDSTASR